MDTTCCSKLDLASVGAQEWDAMGLTVRETLGDGATSEVFAGYDRIHRVEVAIKVARRAAEPRTLERFLREARHLAAVRHPSVVGVRSYGVLTDGRPYVVMNRVHGQPLHQVMAKQTGSRMPWQRALPLVLSLLDALEALHEAGIVHRDVKPANILMDSCERLVLVDLGFARGAGGSSARLTPANLVVGTPGFIAPELLLGGEAMPAADVFSVGVNLHLLLTGRLPFVGSSAEIIRQLMNEPPPRVLSLAPDVPRRVAMLADMSLARDPNVRFARAGAMARALRGALATLEVGEM